MVYNNNNRGHQIIGHGADHKKTYTIGFHINSTPSIKINKSMKENILKDIMQKDKNIPNNLVLLEKEIHLPLKAFILNYVLNTGKYTLNHIIKILTYSNILNYPEDKKLKQALLTEIVKKSKDYPYLFIYNLDKVIKEVIDNAQYDRLPNHFYSYFVENYDEIIYFINRLYLKNYSGISILSLLLSMPSEMKLKPLKSGQKLFIDTDKLNDNVFTSLLYYEPNLHVVERFNKNLASISKGQYSHFVDLYLDFIEGKRKVIAKTVKNIYKKDKSILKSNFINLYGMFSIYAPCELIRKFIKVDSYGNYVSDEFIIAFILYGYKRGLIPPLLADYFILSFFYDDDFDIEENEYIKKSSNEVQFIKSNLDTLYEYEQKYPAFREFINLYSRVLSKVKEYCNISLERDYVPNENELLCLMKHMEIIQLFTLFEYEKRFKMYKTSEILSKKNNLIQILWNALYEIAIKQEKEGK